MYRDDLAATFARVEQLQRELDGAQSQGVQDRQRIAQLSAQLAAAQQAMARMGAAQQAAMYNPYPQPYPGMGYGSYVHAPRSGAILVLGILSLLMCSLMGPIAWAMGTEELRRIDSGQTEPSGRSNASAGRICGMVSSVFLMCGAFILLMVLATAH